MDNELLDLNIPPDLSPHDSLEIVLGFAQEMRQPLERLGFLSSLLGHPDYADIQTEIIEQVQDLAHDAQYMMDIIYRYDAQRTEFDPEEAQDNQNHQSPQLQG